MKTLNKGRVFLSQEKALRIHAPTWDYANLPQGPASLVAGTMYKALKEQGAWGPGGQAGGSGAFRPLPGTFLAALQDLIRLFQRDTRWSHHQLVPRSHHLWSQEHLPAGWQVREKGARPPSGPWSQAPA